MFDFKDINVNYLKFIVYCSYFTVLSSAVWLGLNVIHYGFGFNSTILIPALSVVVSCLYGEYFERKLNKHKE